MWMIFAVLSAVFAALTSILAKVGIEGVNSNLATAIRTIVVVIMAWGMVFLTHAQNGLAEISKKSWIFLILSGLATGASWLCYYKAPFFFSETSSAGKRSTNPFSVIRTTSCTSRIGRILTSASSSCMDSFLVIS